MQIFGKGFIASHLKKLSLSKKYFIYAAGVSNSNTKSVFQFQKEIKQIKGVIKKLKSKKIFIYISSLSVENKKLSNDKYIKNKLQIEKIIRESLKEYIIIRLPQVVGKNKNKHTLTNWIFDKVKKKKEFILWKNSERNLLDIEDIVSILKKYFKKSPNNKSTINIYNPNSISVKILLKIFGDILRIEPKFRELKRENKNINLKTIKNKTKLPKRFYANVIDKKYINKLIRKYYQ